MKLIISALFEEIEDIFDKYDLIQVKSKFELYKTRINDEEILIGCCGVGKANAAMFTQFCIDHYIIDEVISIGAAGSTNKNLKIGDVVIGTKFIYGDVDVRIFGYDFGQVPQRPKYYTGSAYEFDLNLFDFNIINGTIVTVDSFVSTYKSEFDLLEQKDAIEMESTSIAQVCHLNEKNIICFRCISDESFYSEDAAQSYDITKKTISVNLLKLIENYLGV